MSELTLIATVVANSDAVDAVKMILEKLVEPTRKEEGCEEYNFHQSNDDAATFVFYERWSSEAHLQRHIESAHFVECQQALDGKVAPMQLQKLSRLA